jgi:hypothetical protein
LKDFGSLKLLERVLNKTKEKIGKEGKEEGRWVEIQLCYE